MAKLNCRFDDDLGISWTLWLLVADTSISAACLVILGTLSCVCPHFLW